MSNNFYQAKFTDLESGVCSVSLPLLLSPCGLARDQVHAVALVGQDLAPPKLSSELGLAHRGHPSWHCTDVTRRREEPNQEPDLLMEVTVLNYGLKSPPETSMRHKTAF